jgi:hypothetical protein
MAAANAFLSSSFADLRLFGDVSPVGEDFLPDDLLDARDLDALLGAINAGSLDPLLDLTQDTQVDGADLQVLLDLLGTQLGDANLDGSVDSLDLEVWQTNYGNPGGWLAGNFEGNALVDGRDFLLWQRHVSLAELAASALAVPEPAPLCLMWIALFGRRRRRGRPGTLTKHHLLTTYHERPTTN